MSEGPIEDGVPVAWPPAVSAAVTPFLQSHLVELPSFFYAANVDEPVFAISQKAQANGRTGNQFLAFPPGKRPQYGIITTQSCDLAEERPDPRQPWFTVAGVYKVPKGSPVINNGYVKKLAPPTLPTKDGEDDIVWVADLRLEAPFEKSVLVGRAPIKAFPDEAGEIGFGQWLGARRNRPALGSIVFRLVNGLIGEMRKDDNLRPLANKARGDVMKLTVRVQDGTRLIPKALALYVVTKRPQSPEAVEFFDEWFDRAYPMAAAGGVDLLAPIWRDGKAMDLTEYDKLVEIHNPL